MRTTPTSSPTPVPDPRVSDVRAAAEAYVAAENLAFQTADVTRLHAMCIPGSQADGTVGTYRASVIDSHTAEVVTATSYQQEAISIFSTMAIAKINYRITGYLTSWPALGSPGPSKSDDRKETLTFELVGGKWLLESIQ